MNSKLKDEGKLLSLKEAIQRYLRPKMKLHLAGGIGGPGAAICEIIRQYFGSSPDFEIIQSTVTGHAINLVHCSLVKKLIFSACMEISESAHPSRVIQQAYASHDIDFENWSLLSLQQKLMAGALGVSFMPTRSIRESTLATENKEVYVEMEDPFGDEDKVGVLKAINPELSIIHGVMADVHGNTILPVPYGDDVWGSLASVGGVLITVEKIVSSDVIRKYASLVKIPSSIVRAVSVAPMGIHPFSLANPVRDIVESYEADARFLQDLHDASSDSQRLNDWINAWIMECPTHDTYLQKLGKERISNLKKSSGERISSEEKSDEGMIRETSKSYTRDEMVLVAAARAIVDSVMKSKHKTMLVGAGSWSIAAQLAYYELIKKGYEIDLITGNGQIGYIPHPGASSAQTVSGICSSKMLTDTITTHGVFVGGKNNKCLSILGAGQIDKYGNINSSRTSDGDFLVGTGGANDAANANEVMVILHQSNRRFVETIPYITARGNNVRTVISTMGVFNKSIGNDELSLMACLPDSGSNSLEKSINKIKGKCAWDLKTSQTVHYLNEPTLDELSRLRSLFSP